MQILALNVQFENDDFTVVLISIPCKGQEQKNVVIKSFA